MNNFPQFLSSAAEFVLCHLSLDELNEEFTLTRVALQNDPTNEDLQVHLWEINEFRLELL
jgi:hypothetical protein